MTIFFIKYLLYSIILYVTSNVIAKIRTSPIKNTYSAISSYCALRLVRERSDKNESKQLAMNITSEAAVMSSMNDSTGSLKSFSEVSAINHNPTRFADVLRIYPEFDCLFSIKVYAAVRRVRFGFVMSSTDRRIPNERSMASMLSSFGFPFGESVR